MFMTTVMKCNSLSYAIFNAKMTLFEISFNSGIKRITVNNLTVPEIRSDFNFTSCKGTCTQPFSIPRTNTSVPVYDFSEKGNALSSINY